LPGSQPQRYDVPCNDIAQDVLIDGDQPPLGELEQAPVDVEEFGLGFFHDGGG